MSRATIINIGQEQLIALPKGFHIDAEQVSISKTEDSFIIKAINNHNCDADDSINRISSQDASLGHPSEFQKRFLAWRKSYEASLEATADEDWDDPWENIRSQEIGRDFSWED